MHFHGSLSSLYPPACTNHPRMVDLFAHTCIGGPCAGRCGRRQHIHTHPSFVIAFQKSDQAVGAGNIGDDTFRAHSLTRPSMLLSIMEQGYRALWIDSDTVLLGSLFSVLPDPRDKRVPVVRERTILMFIPCACGRNQEQHVRRDSPCRNHNGLTLIFFPYIFCGRVGGARATASPRLAEKILAVRQGVNPRQCGSNN